MRFMLKKHDEFIYKKLICWIIHQLFDWKDQGYYNSIKAHLIKTHFYLKKIVLLCCFSI